MFTGQINLGSLKHQFNEKQIRFLEKYYWQILLISYTKLDVSFLSAQFKIYEFTAQFKFDKNNNWGGLLIYIREEFPCRQQI